MLNDPKAAKVRGVAKLVKKDARQETGLFLLEGPQGLKEALDRPKLILEVFATEEALSRHADLFARLETLRIQVQLVSESVLKVMCDTNTPQGVLAVCHQLDVTVEEVIESKPRLIVLLSQVRDPGNAGTVLRAADAAGADAVLFSSASVDIYNPKVVRSTTGSLFHLPVVVELDLKATVSSLRKAGHQILAADASGAPLTELIESRELEKPTTWLFGNEAWGFTPEELALADRVVAVPIYGAAESLNLATAASVCLYASAFQQNTAV
ncbi:MAG: TrmH family RNA methyltransferase [Rhodoluna sp.]